MKRSTCIDWKVSVGLKCVRTSRIDSFLTLSPAIKSISKRGPFCSFSFTTMSNARNVYETFTNTIFPFKNFLSLTIQYRMYLNFL